MSCMKCYSGLFSLFKGKWQILSVFIFLWQGSFAQMVYEENEGLVVMEAENTPSPLGLWVNSTNFPGYSGSGHIEFTGNVPAGQGMPLSPLVYKFKINTTGDYALLIRGRSRLLEGEAKDLCNDAWVRLEGDYEIGTGGPPDTSWLNKDTKMFVGRGGNGDWGWASKFDINHVQPEAIYRLKKGEVYSLYMSGRSKRFNVDRLVFAKTTTDFPQVKNLPKESSWYNDGKEVERYEYYAIDHFNVDTTAGIPFYKDKQRNALAIDASIASKRGKFARAFTTFTGKEGKYDAKLQTLSEFDGESTYRLFVNGRAVGIYTNSPVSENDDFKQQEAVFKAIDLYEGDTIAVEFNTHSNAKIPEGNGYAWARGRWQSITLKKSVPQGRLAVVTDGNYRDTDDIGATPVSLAILSAFGLEDKLVYYSHSCDLKPGKNDPGGAFREEEMKISCEGTAELWGGFEHINFLNCMQQKSMAVKALTEQINTATLSNPLWIIEAGEPDIIWEAVNLSNEKQRQFVHIVTHHPANDKGDYHDLSDVMNLGIPSINLHRIPDQNKLLKKSLSDWYWARDHNDEKINWLWDRGFKAQTKPMKYPPIDGYFDVSDAGMVYYWATLPQGGDMECDVPKLKKLFLNLK